MVPEVERAPVRASGGEFLFFKVYGSGWCPFIVLVATARMPVESLGTDESHQPVWQCAKQLVPVVAVVPSLLAGTYRHHSGNPHYECIAAFHDKGSTVPRCFFLNDEVP